MANPTANPFGKKQTTSPFAPTAPVVAAPQPTPPVATPVVEVQNTEAPKRKKSIKKDGSERARPNRPATPDEIKYIIANYQNMDRGEIAKNLDLTGQQVYRKIYEARKYITEKVAELSAAGQTDKAAKMQQILDVNLASKPFGGGRSSGSGKGSTVASVIDELLA